MSLNYQTLVLVLVRGHQVAVTSPAEVEARPAEVAQRREIVAIAVCSNVAVAMVELVKVRVTMAVLGDVWPNVH